MKRKEYENATSDIPKNIWIWDIKDIYLKNGRVLTSDIKRKRYLFTNYGIYISYGDVECYGDILPSEFIVSFDHKKVAFNNNYLNKNNFKFRHPKEGDFLVSTEGTKKQLSKSIITKIERFANGTFISVLNEVKISNISKFSFYDPNLLRDDSLHNYLEVGSYLNFIPNNIKYNKDYTYNEFIKFKHIVSIG